MRISEMSYFNFCLLLLLPGELGSPLALGPRPSQTERSGQRFLVLSLEWSIADEWHKRESLVKWEVHSWDRRLREREREGERERAREQASPHAQQHKPESPGRWVSIFYWQLLTRGRNIYYLGWKAGFLLFFLMWSEVSCQGICHLGLSGLIRLLVLSGQASDFPEGWPWLPLADLQVSC